MYGHRQFKPALETAILGNERNCLVVQSIKN